MKHCCYDASQNYNHCWQHDSCAPEVSRILLCHGDRKGLQIAHVLSIFMTALQPGTAELTTDAILETACKGSRAALQSSCNTFKLCVTCMGLLLMAGTCVSTHDADTLAQQFPRDPWTFQSKFCVFGTHQGSKTNNKW